MGYMALGKGGLPIMHWLLKQILLVSALTALCTIAPANEHELFLKAESHLRKGHVTQANKIIDKLTDHPLKPYLEAKKIKRRFYRLPVDEINHFLKRSGGAPYASELRRAWLHYLARREKWKLYLDYYQPTESLVRQCHYVRALDANQQMVKAHHHGKRLWLLGKSLPKACDPVFALWKKKGLLTPNLIWQRLVNALDQRQYRLVSYLRKRLPVTMKQDYKNLRQLWRHPKTVFNSEVIHSLPENARFIVMKRAVKRHPEHYITPAYDHLNAKLNSTHRQALQETVFHSAAKAKDLDAFEWYYMAAKQGPISHSLKTAFLEGAVRNQNWPLFTHLFKLMPDVVHDEAKWQYWQGRALTLMKAHPSSAIEHFEIAAQERDYYGFMAAQALGISATMNHTPTYVSAQKVQATRLSPSVRRALALFELGRITPARREWRFAFEQLDLDGRKALALLAGRHEWADRAILTLAKLRDWHDLQLRFPLAHSNEISRAAKRTQLQPNWIYGVARQESAFQFDARSSAGAMGLMQVMPRTARSVSQRYRMRYSKKRLLKPTYNVEIGSRYMRLLLNRFDGNRVLATAAYNAGPHNVKRWLKRFSGPVDLWIENIPFKETREYVQKVLAYSTIYSYRLGELQPILDRRTLAAWEDLNTTNFHLSKSDTNRSSKPLDKG